MKKTVIFKVEKLEPEDSDGNVNVGYKIKLNCSEYEMLRFLLIIGQSNPTITAIIKLVAQKLDSTKSEALSKGKEY